MLTVGIDDGYAETKVVFAPDTAPFVMPTCAQAGGMTTVRGGDMGIGAFADGDSRAGTYEVGDRRYAVGEGLPSPSRATSDEYPWSPMNRAIVGHALIAAKVPMDAPVKVVSGLPVRRYYRSMSGIAMERNKALIKRKRDNLTGNPVMRLSADGKRHATHQIAEHIVLPEAYGAWVNYAMEMGEDGLPRLNSDVTGQRVAVIDIGGRTTDLCVVRNANIDMQRTGTIPHGTLEVESLLKSRIEDHKDVQLTPEQVMAAMQSGKVRIFGDEMDFISLRREVINDVFGAIGDEVKALLGQAADVDVVLFVGGGSVLGREHLDAWYPHNAVFPERPGTANAEGFRVYGMMS